MLTIVAETFPSQWLETPLPPRCGRPRGHVLLPLRSGTACAPVLALFSVACKRYRLQLVYRLSSDFRRFRRMQSCWLCPGQACALYICQDADTLMQDCEVTHSVKVTDTRL